MIEEEEDNDDGEPVSPQDPHVSRPTYAAPGMWPPIRCSNYASNYPNPLISVLQFENIDSSNHSLARSGVMHRLRLIILVLILLNHHIVLQTQRLTDPIEVLEC